MTIIKIGPLENGQHPIQSQEFRKMCWINGWVEVPDWMEESVWATAGFCDLDIRAGKLVGIIPQDKPTFDEPESKPTPEEQLRADVDYLAAMTGVTL